ncbi:MAG: hypothetical protein PHQ89_00275 [Bacilli bacterium]|nr:hypothetical protein [Bacilli bacterium]
MPDTLRNKRIMEYLNRDQRLQKLLGENQETSQIINNMIENHMLEDLIKLSMNEIYGNEIVKLYNNCSKGDINLFHQTITLFGNDGFSNKQIHDNLKLNNPICFIDNSIPVVDMPSRDDKNEIAIKAWKKYLDAIKNSFENKYQEEHNNEFGSRMAR